MFTSLILKKEKGNKYLPLISLFTNCYRYLLINNPFNYDMLSVPKGMCWIEN